MNEIRTHFFFDFETRSRADLKLVGTVKYATDPSTEATLLTYCFGRVGMIKVWRLGQAIPEDIIHVALNPDKYKFIAQNIQFDYLIWTCVFSRLFPIPLMRPQLENLDDLMALSCYFKTGASLESMAIFHKLPHSKDKEGRVIMLKQCKPNAKGEFPVLTEKEWESFIRYGIMDTRLLREIYFKLPALPAQERWAWEWTFRRNLRGVRIDEPLLAELNSIVEEMMPLLVNEFNKCTNFKAKINSPTTCLAFFSQYYPGIKNMQAETVREMLEATHYVPDHVKRALEIKDLAGSTSISKLKTAIAQKHYGRVYAILAYAFAHTNRWAGRGIQIQNFPRVDNTLADSVKFDMDSSDLVKIIREKRPYLKDPIGFVKNLLRRLWIPDDGLMFYGGDFSKVEPSVLLWLLDMGPIPKYWYEEMAAEIYNMSVDKVIALGKDSAERTVGKQANLSCQYGTGWEGFKRSVKKDTGIVLSEEMARQVVDAYRKKNSKIVSFWKDLETAFRKAILGETTSLCNGRLFVMPMPSPWKGVQIRLPSGNHLFYHEACIKQEEYEQEIVEMRDGFPFKYKVTRVRNALRYLADMGQGRVSMEPVYGGLLCVAGGTPVLTKRGWVKIEEVSNTDILWDGVEWVESDGHVYNGEKETILSHGAWFTPDHLILTDKGWKDASQGKRYNRATCRLPDGYKVPWLERAKVFVGSAMRLWSNEIDGSYRVHKNNEEKRSGFMRVPMAKNFIFKKNYSWNGSAPSVCSMEINEVQMPHQNAPCLEKLWRKRNNCLRTMARIFSEFLGRHGRGLSTQSKHRQDQQRLRVFQGKLQVDNKKSTSEQQTKLKKVYDIINCGPRNRFVVLAGGAPLIVHNCENVVSGTARDIMVPSMWRLEQSNFDVLGCIHDEIWSQSNAGREKEYEQIMCINPSWCDMKIGAEVKEGRRYLK